MEDAAAGASAAAGSSWHEQLTPANADGSTHTGAPSCAETDMDDSSMPTPADAPVSMRMHNRSHRNVERRAARRAALHAGQAGHCPYIVHPRRTMHNATPRAVWSHHYHVCQTPAMNRLRFIGEGDREGWENVVLPGNIEI